LKANIKNKSKSELHKGKIKRVNLFIGLI
jgi:hypothetical protein